MHTCSTVAAITLVAGLSLAPAGPSSAAPLVSFDTPGAGVIPVTSGTLARHTLESDSDLFRIDEGRAVTADTRVNRLSANGTALIGETQALSGTFDSTLFFFDRLGNGSSVERLSGRIVFGGEILGVMIDQNLLRGSNATPFYATDIVYQDVGRLNPNDYVRIVPGSGDTLEFSLNVSSGHDIFRVLTAAAPPLTVGLDEAVVVPSEGAAAMMLLSGLMLGLRRQRLFPQAGHFAK